MYNRYFRLTAYSFELCQNYYMKVALNIFKVFLSSIFKDHFWEPGWV